MRAVTVATVCFGALLPLTLALATGTPSALEKAPARPLATPAGGVGEGSSGLMVLVSGEQRGYLTPCGCSQPPIGGMPRRGGALGQVTAARPAVAQVRLENGDLTRARGRQDALKAETLVEMLTLLRYDVLNLGEGDFRLGLAYLRSLQPRFRGALLCGNARATGATGIADSGRLFPASVTLSRRIGGREVRVVVVGLLSPGFQSEIANACPEVTLEPPAAVLERLQPELSRREQFQILLYHGPKAEAEALIRRFPGFELVVCAHEGALPSGPLQGSPAAVRIGETQLVASGQEGKHLAQLLFTGPPWQASEIRAIRLGPEVPEEASVQRLQSTYLERVAAEDLLSQVPRGPTPNGDRFAGPEVCGKCHPGAQRVWQGSSHARAFRTLVEAKHDRDPECVGCHVVGLEQESGFVSTEATPQLRDVSCESCHGAAEQHAQNPKLPLVKAGERSCAACHLPEHSPKFNFSRYWELVRH